MALDILIEELEGSLWAAAVGNKRLEGLEVDPSYEEVRWGSIYWARVKTIDAALDAVFLDLDGDNIGILYNSDVRLRQKNGTIKKGGEQAISKTFKTGDFIAVQAKTAYIPQNNNGTAEKKIPQMSMDITLAGRYLVFAAMINENRVSQRIQDKKLRALILKTLDSVKGNEGFIVRAAAAGIQTEILMREGKILKAAWSDMQQYLKGAEPTLIMLGPDAVQRVLSDKAGQHIETIEVVTMEHFNHVEEWCSLFAPDLVTKIQPLELDDATEDLALFHHRDIVGQIGDLFRSYEVLPDGANIIIQPTAALTAIDVNKSGDKRSNLAINLDAAKEIARQIRLRNTGGSILIDFLHFQSKPDEKKILAALEKALQSDPCTVQIHGRTNMGFVEISRKRRTPALSERFDGVL
jgi:Rne/Rng family ribonuclease